MRRGNIRLIIPLVRVFTLKYHMEEKKKTVRLDFSKIEFQFYFYITGVPAALFMVMAKTLLKDNILTNPQNLSAVMYETNNQLCAQNDADMFVTLFSAIIDLSSGEMTFANAGHNPPLVRRADKFSLLGRAQSPIFGTIPDLTFPSKKIRLEAGDAIFLYTDGVTDAMNQNHELFGEKRLQLVLDKISFEDDAKKILSEVKSAVKDFVGSAPQSDDITMLALVLCGKV